MAQRHRQLAVKTAAGKRQEGALIAANAIELALDQCIAQQIATCGTNNRIGENSRIYVRTIPFITVNIAPKNGLARVL
jgi:hypothetical protein